MIKKNGDKNKNYTRLKKWLESFGVELFGTADISSIKQEIKVSQVVLKKIDTAISLGVRLSSGVLDDIAQTPTRLYFHHYRSLNVFLDQLAFRLSNHIQSQGYVALAIPASQILDWQSQSSHLSHKKIAWLAGLGWIGRNNLLVNEKFGSQFRLVTVLTNMPLKLNKPKKINCGSCRKCVSACPAGAIDNDPEKFDHLKCFEKLKEFQRKRFVDQYICGICVRVCGGKKD